MTIASYRSEVLIRTMCLGVDRTSDWRCNDANPGEVPLPLPGSSYHSNVPPKSAVRHPDRSRRFDRKNRVARPAGGCYHPSMILDASPTETGRWAAVLDRDAAADGQFVYAVSSTGIYCRPSCPSRRPNRRNVRFFSTPDAAEADGYRACRRCRPRQAETDTVRRVRSAQRYLDQHLDERVTLERLGDAVGLSPYHLQRTFKRVTGVSPRAYAGARRMERMKSRLKQGDTVSRATYDAGFSSPSRAYDESRARLGMTPGAYRNGGRGVAIRFTTMDTALGVVLVAATQRGVCFVALGDETGALEAGLRREFPAAQVERADDDLQRWAGAVIARLASDEAERVRSTSRHAVPVAGVGSTAADSSRRDPDLRPDRARPRPAFGGAMPSPAPARPTRCRSSSLATASSGGTAGWAAIAGASIGSGSCWRWRSRRRRSPADPAAEGRPPLF